MLSNFLADDGDEQSGRTRRYRMSIATTIGEAEIAERADAVTSALNAHPKLLRGGIEVTWHWHGVEHVMFVFVNSAGGEVDRKVMGLGVLLKGDPQQLATRLV